MGQIIYKIVTGIPDFIANIVPEEAAPQILHALGEYSFDNIPAGEYVLTVVDSEGCYAVVPVEVTTTSTTTEEPVPETTTTSTSSGDTTTTSTTTEGITTTTTTLIPTIQCAEEGTYTGGESFPYETDVILGGDLGFVVLDYDAFYVPDKFIVTFDGSGVIDTGYRGQLDSQPTLDACLAAKSLPSETLQGLGGGSAYFEKLTATTIANVKVYAPCEGTAWSFTLNCPEETLPTRIYITNYTLYDTSIDCDVELFADDTYPVTEKGVCWAVGSIPTILDDKVASGDTTLDPFTVTLTPLLSNVLYYCRAYVTINGITTYSNALALRTLATSTTTTTTEDITTTTTTTSP